ncbi:MAG: ATP synthase subunit I [Methylococcales bacterium]|nr:ATP synthase subunit I [Methylococcales bacterium]
MSETFFQNIGFLFWGVALGFFYFGGLWFTVRRLTTAKYVALWMLASFVIRNLLVVIGFYPVVLQGWQSALFCLAGFIMIRFVLIHRIKVQFN